MADRDVEFQIKATDRSAKATEGAADNFEHLGHEADKAARKVDELGDQTGQLARKLAEARASALALARQFDKTGDPKLLKDFQKINAEAAKLGRVNKTIKFDEIDDEAKGIVDKIVQTFGKLPVEVQTAVGGAAIVAVGALQGAVLAAVAAGGIAGGLILGAKDDRVKAAYAKLGQGIMTDLKTDARGFTDELLQAAPLLQAAFERQEPRIQRIFNNLQGVVRPILDNIINSVERLGPSLERASAAGGKILLSTSATLPILADSIGRLLDQFSDNSSGAATSLNLLVLTVAGAVTAFTYANEALDPFLMGLGKLGELSGITSDHVKQLGTIQKDAGAGAGLTAQQYAMLSIGMGNTAVAAQALDDSFHRLFDAQMGVDEANLKVNMDLQILKETIKGNQKSLDESTQSGAENERVILRQIQALQQKRDADVAAGNGTKEASEKANAAYISQLEGLRQLLYSLGLNHAEVDKLINAYEELAKPQVKTFTTVYRTQGTPPGYSDEKTGHSQTGNNDYGGLDGWRPAAFAASGRGAAFAMATGGGGYSPPVQVHSEHAFTVQLDGQPFRAIVQRTTSAAEKRTAWRAKVGRR